MKEIDYLQPEKFEQLLKNLPNTKQRVIVIIMHDCGLRVTETITLLYSNFNFKTDILKVKTLKVHANKQGEKIEKFREIPITQRLKVELEKYITEELKAGVKISQNEYIFKGKDEGTHYSYKAVWKFLKVFKNKNMGFQNLHSHQLRHTFASNAVTNNVPLYEVKNLLGHTNINTTTIYTHTPTAALKNMLEYRNKKNFLQTFKERFFPTKQVIINIPIDNKIFVGRKEELHNSTNLALQGVNIAIIGKKGLGKSSLMDSIKNELTTHNRKIIEFDDLDNIKQTLINTLLYLYDGDKEAVKSITYPNLKTPQIRQRLTRDSVKNLCDEIKKLINPKEYFLMIDDFSKATPKAVKTLEELQNHFIIILATREVTMSKSGFLWGFELIRLKELNRADSLELIHKLSYDLEVENQEIYRNHIYTQSNGNPQVIVHLIERYRKEPFLTEENIRRITHYGSMKEIDLTIFVFILLICVFALKFIGKEVEENYQLIAGLAMILLLLTRIFMKYTARKTI